MKTKKVLQVSSPENSGSSRSTLAIRVAAVAGLMLSWGLAASDRLPASIGSAAHAAESDLVRKDKSNADHDLSALRVFNRVVLLIKDNYYDPKRIQPRKMLVQALDNVERQVAEIMVDGDEKGPKIKVTVNKVSKEFDISGVDTFWRMSFALKDVFDFVNKNLSAQSKEDSREIEYAAVNGMLSTLDPHSVLLKPDYFKEMKLQTKGEFGGLGFIIQMKEGNLTVVRVLKGTPAQRAGIRSKDVIQRIGNESTVNMDLNDAVDRLRGKPGSDVTLTVLRASWPGPKQMTLTRAVINVESVEAKLLDGNVGYIKVKGFQGNTARDLQAELKRLKQDAQQAKDQTGKPGLKGIVLDLRGNPGGLLEQAKQVSDAFVSEGTIVTTVGYSDKMREVSKAHSDDTDTNLPLVVLVNAGSASASEIVAGALKNLNRAVVVGRQSFGKGSVQVLYDFPDESALKLTIAQYLTPGDVSIQEVGITPDIELVPSRVTKDRIDVFAPRKTMGEADLSGHFGNPSSDKVASKREEAMPKDKPLEELRFLKDEPPPPKDAKAAAEKKEKPDRDDYEADDIEGEDPDTDEIVEDYQIRFARDLLLAAPASTRDQMLKAAKPFIAGRRAEEAVRIEKAIEALGLDWNAGEMARSASGGAAPRLTYEMKPATGSKISAGETLAWTVTVDNPSTVAAHRLRAWSESDNPYLDRREFLFGAVAPGEKKTWTVNVKLAKEMVSRRDEVTLKFFDDEGDKLEDLKGEVNVVELPRPLFAYSWQIVDKCDACNGDGLAQPGETVELAVEVKNVGTGKAYDLLGSLKNKGDEKISLSKGRSKMGEVLPGQTKSGTFEFEVKPDFKAQTAPLQLTMGDEATDEFVTEKIALPVSTHKEQGKPQGIVVRAAADVPIYAAAAETSAIIGTLKKGAALNSDVRFGEMDRIHMGNNRQGFVSAKLVKETRAADAPKAPGQGVESVEMRTEPKIVLSVDTATGGIATDADKFTLSGTALDKTGLRDLYVFVNEQKVFFEAAREPGAPIKFNVDLPLKAGNNAIVVVAREDQDFMARKLLIIHRRGEAPKTKVVELKPGARSPDSKEADDHRLRSPPEGGVVPAPQQ